MTTNRQIGTRPAIRRALATGLCAAAASLSMAVPAAPAAADAGCTHYAAPVAEGGSDANPGTKASPMASPFRLLERLSPGQTGCLKDGATFHLGGGEAITSTGGSPGSPKTLRPETPGARATVSAASGMWFQLSSHDLVLRDLDLRRPSGTGGGSLLLLDGDRITLDGIDASYQENICLDIGADARAGQTDASEDIVIRRSRVHHCGSAYGPPRRTYDSGVHGIYVQFTRRLLIEDSYVYANNNRGIQLYPDADGSVIRRNVLHGNGGNLNLGSERSLNIASENNLVENNVLAGSTLSGLSSGGFVGDIAEVVGNFREDSPGVPDYRNRVERNCISNAQHPDKLYDGPGFTRANNLENVDARFLNPGAGDFRMASDSPCVDKGPAAGSAPTPPPGPAPNGPVNDAAPTVTLAPLAISAGQVVTVTYRGPAGATVEILARTYPATQFSRIGSVTLNRNGLGTSTHRPQKNTRLTARSSSGAFSSTAPVIGVRSVASFNVERVGTRTVTFSGRVYPALNQRLVNVYRDGRLVAQARSDGAGLYRVTRTLGGGTYTFQARTPNDAANLGATSPQRRVLVY